MKTLLAVVGDGTAGGVIEMALLAARPFNGCIVGLNALTTEYAVVFGGEMGFSVSSEVDRTLEREGQDRREQARTLFHGDAAARRHGRRRERRRRQRRVARGSGPPERGGRCDGAHLRAHRRRAPGEARLARRGDARGSALRGRAAGADDAASAAADVGRTSSSRGTTAPRRRAPSPSPCPSSSAPNRSRW